MANKRDLKHEINFITNELVNECLFLKEYTQEMPAEKCESLINRILDIQDEYIRRTKRFSQIDKELLQKTDSRLRCCHRRSFERNRRIIG